MFTEKTLLKLNKVPTPFYYYDLELLEKNIANLKAAAAKHNYIVHYAMKANSNDKILKIIAESGLGADCVSGNEIKKAVETGFNKEGIVFSGVGKSDEEIIAGLNNDIFCFNCESAAEIEVINKLAEERGKIASIALRLNPNVDANTHHYITTGLEENKFGINAWEIEVVLKLLRTMGHIKLIGLHFHIGSQITDLNAFKSLCLKVNEMQQWFLNNHFDLKHVNVGGGLGVNYHEPDKNALIDFETYFNIFSQLLEVRNGQQVHFELGRTVVAQCASLISKVLFVKEGINTNFAILDAGMTELIRPALYQSYHKIENLSKNFSPKKSDVHRYDVVGPICESSDCFGKAVNLPKTERGDLMAIRSTGAYGEAMSSGYNLRTKAQAVYSDEL